ncbi:MAG: VanZ family protein [Myxococcaceae bacterium]
MRRFLLYIFPILAYAGLIFFLSSRSSLPAPRIVGFDKVAHFGEYAILGLLFSRAMGGYGVRPRRAVVITIGLCLLYGVSDEVHQMFTPRRQADPLDLVADVLGGSAGALTWYLLRRSPERGEKP